MTDSAPQLTHGFPFKLGYNTNGLPFHRLDEGLRLVADLGYDAVAITPDVGCLDPFRISALEVRLARSLIADLGLAVAIETGARFILDPRRKHRPTLLEHGREDRRRRIDFYRRAVDLAVDLGASVVSLWTGAAPEDEVGTLDANPSHPLVEVLSEGLAEVLAHADARGVSIALEPEPGMFIERPVGFTHLLQSMGAAGDSLGMTLDLGHCTVTGDLPVSDVVERYRSRIVHVHIADCPHGRHEHLPLGEGDLDLADALGGLTRSGFSGMAAVELSRDGHRAPLMAAAAMRSIIGTQIVAS